MRVPPGIAPQTQNDFRVFDQRNMRKHAVFSVYVRYEMVRISSTVAEGPPAHEVVYANSDWNINIRDAKLVLHVSERRLNRRMQAATPIATIFSLTICPRNDEEKYAVRRSPVNGNQSSSRTVASPRPRTLLPW